MADMSALFASAMPGNLVPGFSYLIIVAQKVLTESGLRLFVKLRVAPQNIFCKMQGDLTYLFTDYQIEQINKEKLFVNLSFRGKSLSGDSIIQVRNAALPTLMYEEITAAGVFDL